MEEQKPIVLGWTRDEKGNVVDRHPVDVANTATAGKRENTQNYVIKQIGRGFNKGGEHDICTTISSNSFECNNLVLEEILKDVRKKYPNRGIFLHDGKIYFIRKLTPRECFRLMGVSDADIDKIQAAGISKSQQFKMAGNSICVPTLTAILRQLFIGNFNKLQQTEIF